jgi:peptide/nickel transport system ATP-binding protein
MTVTPLLSIGDLRTHFQTPNGPVRAVDGVSFDLNSGETLGIVGESGCGKTVACLSILRLVDEPGRIEPGSSIKLRDKELCRVSEDEMREIRGNEISMIFQEPMTSLNPVWTVGNQIAEAVRVHRGASAADARSRAIEMLGLVGIPDPDRRVDDYPHELSGGMRQRVMIAMAKSSTCSPTSRNDWAWR